jgi:integrase/recombinase XerD
MNLQFERLLEQFKESMEIRELSPRTIPEYVHNVSIFLNYLEEVGISEISEVNQDVFTSYQLRILEETFKDKPIGAATRLRRLSTIRCFFAYLMKIGVLTHDPSVELELPKRPKSLPKDILTKKEIGKMLALPDLSTPLGIRDRAILETLYSTGIRVSELCNLTLNDIDIAKGELRVNQGKNAKDRLVPLGEVACDYLDTYLRQSRKRLASFDQNALFVTKSGRKFRSTNLSFLISRYGKKTNSKKHISSHSLRHTCASHLLQGKADIRYIQEMLGHASLSTTQIYTKVEISDLKKIHHRCHPRERNEVPVNDGWF